ncbi:hypothetical protein E2C01_056529 [Portunus trituberculatus]|uniref:Uncharacterized protein n=1 Tax=Portunus trituberculatus TaxID=210409 RepID=A0A5B7H0S7_PORTR|nr:hypothetical protein [Portunus trituberculatus]
MNLLTTEQEDESSEREWLDGSICPSHGDWCLKPQGRIVPVPTSTTTVPQRAAHLGSPVLHFLTSTSV